MNKVLKYLENNWEKCDNTDFWSHNFLGMASISQSTKEAIYKMNFIDFKGFLFIKVHYQELKKGTSEWEITFVKQIIDKGLVSRKSFCN